MDDPRSSASAIVLARAPGMGCERAGAGARAGRGEPRGKAERPRHRSLASRAVRNSDFERSEDSQEGDPFVFFKIPEIGPGSWLAVFRLAIIPPKRCVAGAVLVQKVVDGAMAKSRLKVRADWFILFVTAAR